MIVIRSSAATNLLEDERAACAAFAELRDCGCLLLRDFFDRDALTLLRQAAIGCFQSIQSGNPIPPTYRYNASSHSSLLNSLLDFGCASESELFEPISRPHLERLFTHALGDRWHCRPEHSWVRKKFALSHVPASGYHLQNWHQDGALGVCFPLERGQPVPIRELVTCWIPLQDCGVDSPGLEFIRRRQPALLHFTELDDSALRGRFDRDEFWAPALKLGDGLLFLNDVLHRTHVRPEMARDRLSVEYRIFPREGQIEPEAFEAAPH